MVMMKDKVCVVTGANTGIGFEIALGLAKQEELVVLVCRDIHKGNDANYKIEESFPDASVYLIIGDLSSNDKTRALADKIIQEYKMVHVLIHNAGVWPITLKVNEDELEETFCVNHLSLF
jgi:NAD(P)-dependent dehydrogenase (short-subunit alcohol dehydrogenase family)